MPDVELSCPRCAHRLRVPTNLLGEEVECPACQHRFTAPTRPEDVPAPGSTNDDGFEPYTREQALIQVRRPGIALMLIGLLAMVGHGIALWQFYADPEAAEARSQWLLEAGTIDKEAEVEPPPFPLKQVRIMGWVSLSLSALMFLGGLATLTLWGYPIAVLGSFAGTINIGGCCCVISGPIGVWCFANLIDPDVKQHFSW